MAQLHINEYPTKLSDDEIDTLCMIAFRRWDHAPVFFGWLTSTLQAEQVRRLNMIRLVESPIERPAIPIDWPNSVLSQALPVATALAESAPSYACGKFVDAIVHTLNAIVSHRLETAR